MAQRRIIVSDSAGLFVVTGIMLIGLGIAIPPFGVIGIGIGAVLVVMGSFGQQQRRRKDRADWDAGGGSGGSSGSSGGFAGGGGSFGGGGASGGWGDDGGDGGGDGGGGD